MLENKKVTFNWLKHQNRVRIKKKNIITGEETGLINAMIQSPEKKWLKN